MCGIAGFYQANVDQVTAAKVMTRLRHRGPDSQGFYQHLDVGLLHTRLSIIELSDLGSQPYRYNGLVLTFNGELYNYKEVRGELMKKGYSFQSNSDTEVLIKAFHCWREICVQHFIGMFAFSIYDESTDELYLFRDRVGVKPLYFTHKNGALFFASELKALMAFPVEKRINHNAVSLYFRFGFVPASLSIFETVSKLEAGHFLVVTRQGISNKEYWNPEGQSVGNKSEDEWLEELESLLISAFRYRMVADVPVGVFLSGGIDSSLLTAILQKYHGGIHSFTIGFNESGVDESTYAKGVADHLRTEHHEKKLSLEDARSLLLDFYSIYDEPFADTSGIPTAYIARFARENGMKVVLSADGGDELFGGYTHYQQALRLFHQMCRWPYRVRKIAVAGTQTVFPTFVREKINSFNTEHKLYALEEILRSGNVAQFFEAYIANQAPEEIRRMTGVPAQVSLAMKDRPTPLETMMGWDFRYYLPDDLLVKVDRATMFYGVECRDPFLDHRLVEFSLRIPNELKVKEKRGKYLLRKLLSRYVPEKFFERKKQGFSIPIFDWFKRELDTLFESHFTEECLREIPFLNAEEIRHEYKKYKYYKAHEKPYNIEKMWRILSFFLWWEKYMRNET